MVLAALRQYFVPEEFVVDEPREEVTPWETARPEVASPNEDNDLPVVLYSPSAQPRDLLGQISEIMLEQVRLAEKAHRLENGRDNEAEFIRFVRQALPFFDNFNHLLDMAREQKTSEEVDHWLKSVESLYFRLVNLLESFDVVFLSCVGKPVDLAFQEVIEYRRTNVHEHNTVIKEIQKGVAYKSRLLRDARVIVACNEDRTPST